MLAERLPRALPCGKRISSLPVLCSLHPVLAAWLAGAPRQWPTPDGSGSSSFSSRKIRSNLRFIALLLRTVPCSPQPGEPRVLEGWSARKTGSERLQSAGGECSSSRPLSRPGPVRVQAHAQTRDVDPVRCCPRPWGCQVEGLDHATRRLTTAFILKTRDVTGACFPSASTQCDCPRVSPTRSSRNLMARS